MAQMKESSANLGPYSVLSSIPVSFSSRILACRPISKNVSEQTISTTSSFYHDCESRKTIADLTILPEAKGGPLDTAYLFENYLESATRYKKHQAIFQPSRANRPDALLTDLLAKERVGVVPTLAMENMARIAEDEALAARHAGLATSRPGLAASRA